MIFSVLLNTNIVRGEGIAPEIPVAKSTEFD